MGVPSGCPSVDETAAGRSARGYLDGMSAAIGHEPDPAYTYAVARQRKLRRTLESYGALTREDLLEAAHAAHWHVPFDVVLRRAVAAGRVRELSGDLFE